MAWYSSPPLAYSIYLPMALTATALPYALTQHTSDRAPPQPRALQTALLGYALVISAVAGLSVALGMGSGYLFAAWGLCALLAAGFVTLVRSFPCFPPPPSPPSPLLSCGMGTGYRPAAWGLCALLAAGFVTLICSFPCSRLPPPPPLSFVILWHGDWLPSCCLGTLCTAGC